MSVDPAPDRGLVVLTATVRPSGVKFTALTNPDERLAHYVAALDFWSGVAARNGHDVVLIENSGSGDLPEFRRWVSAGDGRHHVISYVEDHQLAKEAKGAGEARMFDRLVEWMDSRQVPQGPITKVTGRLTVTNPGVLSGPYRAEPFWRVALSGDLTLVDTRIMVLSTEVFRGYLTGLASQVDEERGDILERVVARSVLRSIADGAVREPFASMPIIRGVSGSTGRRYLGVRTRLAGVTLNVHRRVSGGMF